VDQIPVLNGQRAEVQFASADSLRALARPSRKATFVEGRITGGVAPGQRVAIAVDGRVRATTLSYRSNDEVHFWAVVPGRPHGRGTGQVAVLGIHGQGAGRRLARFRTPAPEQLSTEGGRTVILTAFGKRAEVEAGAVDGAVDQVVALAGNAVIVRGWAADTDAGRVADRVVVFADGRVLASGSPTVDRPDVADTHGAGVLGSGFQLTAGVSGQATRLAKRLRVFAIHGDRASELKVTEDPEIVD
jgi:hypothetical protein